MTAAYEFKKIYDEYYSRILLYLTRIIGAEDAEDTAQDVFEKVNGGLRQFKGESKLSTWIYRIATNTAIDRSRSAVYKHKREQVPIEEDRDSSSSDLGEEIKPPSTDQLLIKKEMNECIDEYIDTLPDNYKTIIVLSEIEGFTNKEIAEVLNMSLENVKIRLHRARAKLKSILKEACEFYYTDDNTLACDRKQIRILSKKPE
jgi:RNA polymerase sigma-70 factor (ECF subfamily)